MRLQQLIRLAQQHEQEGAKLILRRMKNIFAEMTTGEQIQVLMLLGYRPAERRLLRLLTAKAVAISLIPAILFPLVTIAILRSNQTSASDQIATIVPFAAVVVITTAIILIVRWLRNAERRLPDPPLPEEPVPALTAKIADALYSLFDDPVFLPRLVEMRRYSPYLFAPDKQIAYLLHHARERHGGLSDSDYDFLLSLIGKHAKPASTELQAALGDRLFAKVNAFPSNSLPDI